MRDYKDTEVNFTRFAGGIDRGLCLEIGFENGGQGYSHVQLDHKTVIKLIDILSKQFNTSDGKLYTKEEVIRLLWEVRHFYDDNKYVPYGKIREDFKNWCKQKNYSYAYIFMDIFNYINFVTCN